MFERGNPYKFVDPTGHEGYVFVVVGQTVLLTGALLMYYTLLHGLPSKNTVYLDRHEFQTCHYSNFRSEGVFIQEFYYENALVGPNHPEIIKKKLGKIADDLTDPTDYLLQEFVKEISMESGRNLIESDGTKLQSNVNPRITYETEKDRERKDAHIYINDGSGKSAKWKYESYQGAIVVDKDTPAGTDVGGGWKVKR